MNTKTPVRFSPRTVTEIIGYEAARLLLAIDHAALEYGRDWQMNKAGQVYTVEGMAIISDELAARGHPTAAEKLRLAVRNAIATAPSLEPEPVGTLVQVEHVEASDQQLEEAAASHRRRRDREVSPFFGEDNQ